MRMHVEVAHYLPEFFYVILKWATETISRMKQDLQRSFPIISFNHCSLTSTLPSFKPMVSRPMRGENTIDLFYTNVKEGFVAKSSHLAGTHLVRRCMEISERIVVCVLMVTMNNKLEGPMM